jgi:hypothetical protein
MIFLADDNSCTLGYSFLDVGSESGPDGGASQGSLNFKDECIDRVVLSKSEPRVQFSGSLKVQSVPHSSEFTQQEISQCWITPQDVARINAENRGLVEKASKGELIDEENDSLRGLEKQLRGNKPSRRYQESVVVVMESQDEFWFEEDDFESCKMISSLYWTISRESAADAASIGLQDAKEARKQLSMRIWWDVSSAATL